MGLVVEPVYTTTNYSGEASIGVVVEPVYTTANYSGEASVVEPVYTTANYSGEASIGVHTPDNKVCTDGSTSSKYENVDVFDKTIYRLLSMRDDMKVLEIPVTIRNEFDLFVQTAIAKDAGLEYNTAFDNLDEYLGTIGVTNGIC